MVTSEMIAEAKAKLVTGYQHTTNDVGKGSCDWLTYSECGEVVLELHTWGNRFAPDKYMSIFNLGSERISRQVADAILAVYAVPINK